MKATIKKTNYPDGWWIFISNAKQWIESNPHWGREFALSEEDGVIYLDKPNLDYRGEVRKYHKSGKNYRFYLTSENMREGEFKVKELNSDNLTIEIK